MSNLFFCGSFCTVDKKGQMEIDTSSNLRLSSTNGSNTRIRTQDGASENKEYVVDYFLYKKEKEPELNYTRSHKASYHDSGRSSESNLHFKDKSESIGKPVFFPTKIYQQKSPEQYFQPELDDEERSIRCIDLRASKDTPQLGYDSFVIKNKSLVLTESSNIREQTFGDFPNSGRKFNQKINKYLYNTNVYAWRLKRKSIKKKQILVRVNKEKENVNENGNRKNSGDTEIQLLTSFTREGNSSKLIRQGKVFDNFSIEFEKNNVPKNNNITEIANASNITINLKNNESRLVVPHLEIQTFNNFQLNVKISSEKIEIADTTYFQLQSEKEVNEDLRESNISLLSVHSITYNNSHIHNINNELNLNQPNPRANINLRYDCDNKSIIPSASENISENEMINIGDNYSTLNPNLYLNNDFNNNHSKTDLVASQNISVNKTTLKLEKSRANSINDNSDSILFGLKHEVHEKIDNNEPLSCKECEEFYKISILYNVSLKEMKCLNCNNVMNKTSLDYYKLKLNELNKKNESNSSDNKDNVINDVNDSVVNSELKTDKNLDINNQCLSIDKELNNEIDNDKREYKEDTKTKLEEMHEISKIKREILEKDIIISRSIVNDRQDDLDFVYDDKETISRHSDDIQYYNLNDVYEEENENAELKINEFVNQIVKEEITDYIYEEDKKDFLKEELQEENGFIKENIKNQSEIDMSLENNDDIELEPRGKSSPSYSCRNYYIENEVIKEELHIIKTDQILDIKQVQEESNARHYYKLYRDSQQESPDHIFHIEIESEKSLQSNDITKFDCKSSPIIQVPDYKNYGETIEPLVLGNYLEDDEENEKEIKIDNSLRISSEIQDMNCKELYMNKDSIDEEFQISNNEENQNYINNKKEVKIEKSKNEMSIIYEDESHLAEEDSHSDELDYEDCVEEIIMTGHETVKDNELSEKYFGDNSIDILIDEVQIYEDRIEENLSDVIIGQEINPHNFDVKKSINIEKVDIEDKSLINTSENYLDDESEKIKENKKSLFPKILNEQISLETPSYQHVEDQFTNNNELKANKHNNLIFTDLSENSSEQSSLLQIEENLRSSFKFQSQEESNEDIVYTSRKSSFTLSKASSFVKASPDQKFADTQKSDLKANVFSNNSSGSPSIKEEKAPVVNKMTLRRSSTTNTSDEGAVINAFPSDLMQNSKILGNKITNEQRAETKKLTFSANASKQSIRPSEKRLSEIISIGNIPLEDFRRNSQKQFTSKSSSTINTEFNRGLNKLITKKSSPLLIIGKPEPVANVQINVNKERSTKENIEIAKKNDSLNQNKHTRKPSEKSATSTETNLEPKRAKERFFTNKQTSKLDFNRVLEKQEGNSKDQSLIFKDKKSPINEVISKSNADTKRIAIKRFSDIGRQPILNLNKISDEELNKFKNTAK